MSASTALVTDLGTVYANGPNSATLAKASNQAGPIMDYPGNVHGSRKKLQETQPLLTYIINDTDSTDATNKTLLQGILAAIAGTSSPSSHVIADTKTVLSNGPNAATLAKASNQAGPIMDYPGNVNLILTVLQECLVLLGKVVTDTDASDSTNLTLLQNVVLTLS